MPQAESDAAPWREYPLSSPSYEHSRYHGVDIRDRLTSAKSTCFLPAQNDPALSVRVIDLHRRPNRDSPKNQLAVPTDEEQDQHGVPYKERFYHTHEELEEIMTPPTVEGQNEVNKPRIRIIVIHAKRVISPLQITAQLMQRLLAVYDVAPEFVPIIFSFGDNADLAESGNSNLYVEDGEDGSKKLAYEMRYMEQRSEDEMVSQHTGVYHHHTVDFDLFILLNVRETNVAEQRLRDLKNPGPRIQKELSDMCENPFRIHVLLASSYFSNWRWHLRELARDFSRKNDKAMVLTPEGRGAAWISFDQVQGLRNTQDKVISAAASCKGDLEIMKGLVVLGLAGLHGLAFQIKQLEGFIDSAEVLRSRIRNTIDLIGFSMDHKMQLETVKVYTELNTHTEQVRNLTKDGLKNNTTVTIITLVSAFYLPGSFVSSLFGMNFMQVNDDHTRLAPTQDLWLFFVTWILLMIGTYAMYYFVAEYERRKQAGKSFSWSWRMFNVASNIERGK